MASIKDIEETEIFYAGVDIGAFPIITFRYIIEESTFHTVVVLSLNKTQDGFHDFYVRRGVNDFGFRSTEDPAWIIKKLYND